MSNNEQDKRFTKVLADFEYGGDEDESHADIYRALLDSILRAEQIRRGFGDIPEKWGEVDAETIEKILTFDTDDPRLVLAEKALKRIAGDQGAAGVKLIDEHVTGKARAFSKKQSNAARKARKKHPISILVEELVTKKPSMTEHDLYIALKKEVGGDVIEFYLNDEFTPVDEAFHPVKRSTLRNMLSRAKKKITK
jgi:hypothetical protein